MRLLAAVLLLLSTTAQAGYSEDQTIEEMMVDDTHGKKLFIKVGKLQTQHPSCYDNQYWHYVLPLDNELHTQAFMPMLLSAYAASKKVTLTGKGNCGIYHGVETLRRVQLR